MDSIDEIVNLAFGQDRSERACEARDLAIKQLWQDRERERNLEERISSTSTYPGNKAMIL